MIKRLLAALLVCACAFAQMQENAGGSNSIAAQVGRNRTIVEDASGLPGLHHLVRQVQRRPTGACTALEAQAETDALEREVPVEGQEIASTRCWKIVSQTYSHNLVPNAGLDWLAEIGWKVSTPTDTGRCNYIALTNTAITPGATDTTLSGEITTNGLARAQATYAHTSGATTLTLSKTFTATGTQSAQAGALFTAASGGSMCAEDTFTSASLLSTDTLTISWTWTI